jgi:FkbM family methyltransferase
MELNLARWSQRLTFYLGRYYDLELQTLMVQVLRDGDRFVDIGANIGMISLLASRLVGPWGVVDAFEPNPDCSQAIRSVLARNGIKNVRLHEAGLADTETTMQLTVPRRNTGEATLAAGAELFGGEADTFEVPVRVGDDILQQDPQPPAFIKIDVEGFEHRVLSGLRQTLTRQHPIVITEVVASHLSRDGHTPADLFELMGSLGYQAYGIELPRRRSFGRRLNLIPSSAESHGDNVLWVPHTGPLADRLRGLAGFSGHTTANRHPA